MGVKRWTSERVRAELMGKTRKGIRVISDSVFRPRGRPAVLTMCMKCRKQSLRSVQHVKAGAVGCLDCRTRVPKWLLWRCQNAKQRCTNPNHPKYADYGGRGIQFKFESPLAMAQWVSENLGLYPSLQLDRVSNSGHYEVGNLRLVSAKTNCANRRPWGTGTRRKRRRKKDSGNGKERRT